MSWRWCTFSFHICAYIVVGGSPILFFWFFGVAVDVVFSLVGIQMSDEMLCCFCCLSCFLNNVYDLHIQYNIPLLRHIHT